MSDASFGTEAQSCKSNGCFNPDCDTICIDAGRIYDSCGAKDCLRDLTLMFSEENQSIVENACSVRICKASVITSTIEVEPVVFHRGFYSVDMVFYFAVTVEVYTNSTTLPTTICGLATYGKRVVLYGSDANTKTFTSDSEITCESYEKECKCGYSNSLPRARVQISNPMALSAKLINCKKCCSTPCGAIPECVAEYFGGCLVAPNTNSIAVTIGIFTITQLIRDVQISIPSYDYCVPRKECERRTDDPCEAFSKIEFPTDLFFPPTPDTSVCNSEDNSIDCDCM